MEKWKSASKKKSAFTIVELLTVMGVIAILISLLVPALNLVRDYARELQQRAQFHSIEVAIDMFVANSGYGTYPPSNDNSIPPVDPMDATPYGGAHKLAEALVGQDVLGYHPRSGFRSDLMGYDAFGNPQPVYNVGTRQNLEEREGPFIEGEDANAYMLGDIYANVQTFDPLNYVLCDVYAKKRTLTVNQTIKKTGMPILYYRARTEYFDQDSTRAPLPPAGPDEIDDDIYYYRDNENLLFLGKPEDITVLHPIADNQNDWADFEDMILNTEITTIKRPYRATSFILISAGKDGLYGTGDDITNFTKTE